jgi:hypothetical protein
MHFLSRLFPHLDAKKNRPQGALKDHKSQWPEKPQRFDSPATSTKSEKRKRPEKAEKPEKRSRPEMQQKADKRRGQRLHQKPQYSMKPPSTSSSSSTSFDAMKPKEIYSMASLEMQISKNLDPLLKWAAEKEFSAENIVFIRAVRDFKKKWTMIAKQEQQRLRPPRNTRRGPSRSRTYHTMQQRYDNGLPAIPATAGTIDDAYLAPELKRERYEDAAVIWFQLVNPLTARFNINIDYRTYSDLAAAFHGLRWRPFCSDPPDDSATSSSRDSSKSTDNMVAPWDGYSVDRLGRGGPPQRGAGGAVPLSDVDRLYKIPVTEIVLTEDDAGSDGDAGATTMFLDGDNDTATLDSSETAEMDGMCVPRGFGLDVFDRAYESVKTDVFLNTWPNYEAAFSVRCTGPRARVPERKAAQAGSKVDGLLRRATKRMFCGVRDGE